MKRLIVILSIISMIMPSTAQNSSDFSNEFAFDFYKQLSNTEDNLFFSPYSVSLALAMTYEGAQGETADVMRKVMHFPKDRTEMRKAFKTDKDILNKTPDKEKYIFKSANAIWASEDIKFKQSYFDSVEVNYGAPVNIGSFKRTSDRRKALKEMNQWTEDNTEGKIKELIQETDLSIETIMVLINAVYFKAEWQNKFKEEQTKQDVFIGFEEKKEVSFMRQSKRMKYYEDSYVKAIEIPYYGRKSSMHILLPHSPKHFEKIQATINKAYFDELQEKAEYADIKLELPKFKTEKRIYLEDEFKKAGMGNAFERKANFSGMSDESDICIDKIIHQSFIDVNETGTEAAAATAVIMKRETSMPPGNIVEFIANRPFIYLITDNETGTVLFIGNLLLPEGESDKK